MTAKKGSTAKTAADRMKQAQQEEAAEVKAVADDYAEQRRKQRDRDLEDTIAINVATQRATSDPNGTAAGRWAADFIKEFRKRMAEPDASPTPTTDVLPGTDGDPRSEGASPENPADVL